MSLFCLLLFTHQVSRSNRMYALTAGQYMVFAIGAEIVGRTHVPKYHLHRSPSSESLISAILALKG